MRSVIPGVDSGRRGFWPADDVLKPDSSLHHYLTSPARAARSSIRHGAPSSPPRVFSIPIPISGDPTQCARHHIGIGCGSSALPQVCILSILQRIFCYHAKIDLIAPWLVLQFQNSSSILYQFQTSIILPASRQHLYTTWPLGFPGVLQICCVTYREELRAVQLGNPKYWRHN
jgi:hypothetical protein